MEKRKSKRCPTVSGEISPLRFLKTKLLCQNFLGEQNESECPRCFRKREKRTNVGGKRESRNRRSEGEKAERARERRSECGVRRR